MANKNTIFGARWLSHQYGSPSSGELRTYTCLATDGVALYVGDFVKLTGTSAIDNNGFQRPVVTQAAATEKLVGFVVGFLIHPDYLGQLHRTASTLRSVLVCADPFAYFEIQSTETGAAEDVGQCADIIVGSGSTVTGYSGMQLNHGTLSSTDGQLKIIALSEKIDADFGVYTKFICQINEHEYRLGTGS